jgi:hypothetical protein
MKYILTKYATLCAVLLLASLFVVATQSATLVSAQTDEAVVIVMPTSGGTTDPAPGEYTYANGTNIVLTATPDQGYVFQYWLVSGGLTPGHSSGTAIQVTDPDTGEVVVVIPRPGIILAIDSLTFTTNPTNITCGYGYTYTYTAVFTPTSSGTPSDTNATVIVMPTTGGTVSPTPGSYSYSNNTQIILSATPNSGYQFKYWLISGSITQGHSAAGFSYIYDPENGQLIAQFPRPDITGIDTLVFTANPTNITCGYGYTYTYTAVFEALTPTATPAPTSTPTVAPTATPTLSPEPTATPQPPAQTDWTMWIILAAIVIIVVIAAVVMLMRRKK